MKRPPKKTKPKPRKKSARSLKSKRSPIIVEVDTTPAAAPPEPQPTAMPVALPPEIVAEIREEKIKIPAKAVEEQQPLPVPEVTLEVPERTAVAPEEALQLPEEVVATPEETPEIPEQPVAVPEAALEIPQEVVAAPEQTPDSDSAAAAPHESIPAPAIDPEIHLPPASIEVAAQAENSAIEVPPEVEAVSDVEVVPAPVVHEPQPDPFPSYVELQDEIDQFLSVVKDRKSAETPTAGPAPPPKKQEATPPQTQPPAASAPVKPSDRRTHPRYAFQAQIQVTDTHSAARISSTVRDLSQRGCYANTPSPFALGTTVDVLIVRSGRSFAALARAVYNDPGKGMGLMFTDIEPQHRVTLDAWISESRETSWLATNRRRSQRVMIKLPVRVATAETSGNRWQEETHTVAVSAHGALLVLKAPVSRGQRLSLTNLSTKAALECLVAHIDKPSSAPLQVGVEFLFADPAFWRVAFPPKDWTPRHPDAKSK